MLRSKEKDANKVVCDIEKTISETKGKLPEPEGEKLRLRVRDHRPWREIFNNIWRDNRRFSILGLTLMVAQSFFYNAIFFTYGLVLNKFYGISAPFQNRYKANRSGKQFKKLSCVLSVCPCIELSRKASHVMKAVVLHEYGPANNLKYEEVPIPEPGPDEVLVKVTVTSINPVDWKLRSGQYKAMMPLQFPAVLGHDVAGEVVKTGANVSELQQGQKVMGIVNRSYAEYLTAKASTLTLVPEGLDIEQAGALPVVVLTGAELIEGAIKAKANDTVLITGALGAVGRTAVFVAKQHGVRVIAGVRGKQKAEAKSLGADQVVAIDDEGEIAALPELDAIGDTVGGEVIGKLILKLKKGGVLGSVIGKPPAAEGKDVQVEAFSVQPNPQRLQELAKAVQNGELTIPIVERLPLREVSSAHQRAEKGGAGGKVILLP